ncbi:DUF4249 domain-containing protein [Desertivirga brevis]|uniref:DUF4249 domain-containing protein n=1 Tax=Desertivirga brevis TaxID=2810310 RepID=UPI001A972C50|nr:DUF4249 domain-containing protein [Pedobacter sp. SYSU D00873]
MKVSQLIALTYKKSEAKVFTLLLLAGILFASCEKVVDIDLKDSEPKLVIEAEVNDLDTNHVVRISKTIPFTETNRFNSLSGAQVVLSTPGGQKITFTETEKGVYKSPKFAGVPGTRYVLDVNVEGKVYTASSTMPLAVKLDSLGFRKLSFFGEEVIVPLAYYKDPKEAKNQYLFRIKAKDEEVQESLTEDRFTNGNNVTETLFTDLDELAEGDSLEVEMRGLDLPVYKYYFAIAQISGEGGPPVAPSNPNSNFNNGALGIFSAHTIFTLKAVVKLK